jgi:hypothetical protein
LPERWPLRAHLLRCFGFEQGRASTIFDDRENLVIRMHVKGGPFANHIGYVTKERNAGLD